MTTYQKQQQLSEVYQSNTSGAAANTKKTRQGQRTKQVNANFISKPELVAVNDALLRECNTTSHMKTRAASLQSNIQNI